MCVGEGDDGDGDDDGVCDDNDDNNKKHQHNNTESNSDNINTYALSSIPASSGELDCPSLKMARNDQEGSL